MYKNTKSNDDRSKPVDIEGLVLGETEKAYKIAIDNDTNNEQWLPKSQMSNVVVRGDELQAEIPAWLAEERKLI